MAANTKQKANELFGKISAYNTIIQQNLGKFLNKLSPYAKEYESSLDLVLDILRAMGYSEERLISEILQIITGDASIGQLIEGGYHGSLNSLERKLEVIESKQNNDSFIAGLEDVVKVTISTILTSFLSCSVSPFIPKNKFDTTYQRGGNIDLAPIIIPTELLDFSKTLHISPVSENGIYFYNSSCNVKYYERDDETVRREPINTIADVKEVGTEAYLVFKYKSLDKKPEDVDLKKVISVPSEVKIKEGEDPFPSKYIYIVRPKYTAEALYKTDDMNAFIWYVANRGDNTGGFEGDNGFYEYNKMMWDSRRVNARAGDDARTDVISEGGDSDWDIWLNSRTNYGERLELTKGDKVVTSLYPILQFEPSVETCPYRHIVVSFPEQTYNLHTIYKFNADYLRNIKIFNWKTIVMNMLYELNGISPVPDVRFNLSLSDEIIDARLSTLILDTITADDKEVDDSFYSFSNEDYSQALKQMEIRKYSAKPYLTAGSTAIQNPTGTPLDTMNSVSTAATLNEINTTITRNLYEVAGTSGSTGITKTTLSASLLLESNFVNELLFAIARPFVRALLSPQIMLLFYINLDTMGLIKVGRNEIINADLISDFIFSKLTGIIRRFIRQIKDEIVKFLLTLVKKVIQDLMNEVIILILLEQLNDYIRLLTQIMECIRLFGIGKTLNGIDEVNYADIIPLANNPENTKKQ